MDVKFPEVTVVLVGKDGNAMAILGNVSRSMHQAGVSREDRNAFRTEATSGDYDHLLQTAMRWVNVE